MGFAVDLPESPLSHEENQQCLILFLFYTFVRFKLFFCTKFCHSAHSFPVCAEGIKRVGNLETVKSLLIIRLESYSVTCRCVERFKPCCFLTQVMMR